MDSKKEVAFLCTKNQKKRCGYFQVSSVTSFFWEKVTKWQKMGQTFPSQDNRERLLWGFQVMLVNWLTLADAILDRHSANLPLSMHNILSLLWNEQFLRWMWHAVCRLVCHSSSRKSVTLHHRTQCEVYSLWASQPQQQSETKANETESALDAECFITLLRCSLHHAVQHQVPTTNNGGKSVTVTALTSK